MGPFHPLLRPYHARKSRIRYVKNTSLGMGRYGRCRILPQGGHFTSFVWSVLTIAQRRRGAAPRRAGMGYSRRSWQGG
eukprot:COSAG05_NODE_473_length_9490_cov_16.326696_10_plen_78_part_00